MSWAHANARSCRAAGLLALLAAALLLGGCGYSQHELFPEQYRTIAAPVFENRTFYKRVQFDLANALTKEIERRTPYKLTAPNTADTQLEGVIRSVKQNLVSRSRGGNVPQEVEVVVTVDFTWKDLRTGEAILDRKGFQSIGRYMPTTPVGESFDVAQHKAMQRLATDIVSTLRSGM